MAPPNTRRWPRHQVKLPVRIITASDVSTIVVPGLTTEISQGGMALYGGVPLQPGDLMAVEFQTPDHLRVAAYIRDRNGFCFGLEFLGLLPNDGTEAVGSDLPPTVSSLPPAGLGTTEASIPSLVMRSEKEILALFLEKHEAYLHERELEIKRLRREIQEIRQSRREIELVLLRQVLGRSG